MSFNIQVDLGLLHLQVNFDKISVSLILRNKRFTKVLSEFVV